ncbi:MAG TPA: DUF5658 family protein [Nitrososphaerales archaeon]|nr:DUF5658 family protein [Nitrososphaerales archaeon]
MLDKARNKMKERYAEARLRETKFLMSFDLHAVDSRLLVLLSLFIALNFFDALTTLVAISLGPSFVELNPIASGLFKMDFLGFIAALGLKYIPLVPLIYVTFLPPTQKHVLALRIVKISAFIALVAADVFYLAVVGSNSLNLFHYYYG